MNYIFHTLGLKCLLCFEHPQVPGMESDARFIVNGNAVCLAHVKFAKEAGRVYTDAKDLMMLDYIQTYDACGETRHGFRCGLPKGHNSGKVDIPENHKATT